MPSLDEFKKNQKIMEFKKSKNTFTPKRYAPYLLQEEIIKSSHDKPTIQSSIQQENKINKAPLSDRSLEDVVSRLSGIKKKIIVFMVEKCNVRNSLETGPITSESLVKVGETTYKTIKKILQNMIEDGLIKRNIGKRGKGGFSNFTISSQVKNGLSEYKKLLDYVSNRAMDDVSIRSNNSVIQVEIDYDPLSEIGFTEPHVKQILKEGKLTTEQIQDSINHFAFDVTYNDKLKTIKTDALTFFMGMMRKGTYYNAPSNYESSRALNLRLSLEAKMKREQAEKELETKLKEVEWKEWSEKLTEQELIEFYVEHTPIVAGVPERVQKTLKRKNALANAREYFDGEVWPGRLKELMLGN